MFWPGTLALFTVGLIGVAVLAATTSRDILKLIPIRNPLLARLVLGARSAVLLLALTMVGTAVAGRIGARSVIVDWASGASPAEDTLAGFVPAAIIGIALGIATFLADRLTRPIWSPEGRGPDLLRDWKPSALVAGLTYGGVTEEIMMRWGLMGLVLWLLAIVTGAPAGEPYDGIVIASIAVAAAAFAAGHLPAAFAGGLRSRGFILRTLGLNFVAGLILGWIYWRWNLEAAMVAHAGFHVGGALLVLGLRAAGQRAST